MTITKREVKALDYFSDIMMANSDRLTDTEKLNYDRALLIRSFICNKIRARSRLSEISQDQKEAIEVVMDLAKN